MSDETESPEIEAQQPTRNAASVPGRWHKGMASPNPGGRPRAFVRLQEIAREHTEAAILKLRAIMDDPKVNAVNSDCSG